MVIDPILQIEPKVAHETFEVSAVGATRASKDFKSFGNF
jgi:hypothetical protein